VRRTLAHAGQYGVPQISGTDRSEPGWIGRAMKQV
jgi:hypothetical protein